MAAVGAAAAMAAGGAIAFIAYQTDCCCYASTTSVVPVKKRPSTATSLTGEASCYIAGALTSHRRHITLVGDLLMYGTAPGLAEGSIHLQGANVELRDSEIRILRNGELAMSIVLENDDEADFWADRLSAAAFMCESLPKLISMHNRQRNEEFAAENKQISKMLSLKCRQFSEVEQKANDYEQVAGERSQEVRELQEKIATFADRAAEKEEEVRRARQEVEEEKRRLRTDRMHIESKVASATAEAASRRNEVAELYTEVINAETMAEEKEKLLKKMERAHLEKSHQMEEVQKRLLTMQKLLEQSEAPAARTTRKSRRSLPASFPGGQSPKTPKDTE